LKIWRFIAGFMLAICACALAEAQQTKTQMNTYNNTVIVPNGVGGITASNLHPLLQNMINASCTIADPINCPISALSGATAGRPLIGAASGGGVIQGTVSSATGSIEFGTVSGSAPINGDCASWNSGNLVDSGIAGCGGGSGGSGTVTAGTTGQIATYPSNGTTVAGVSHLPSLDIENTGLGYGFLENQVISGASANNTNFNLLNITNDAGVITGQNFGIEMNFQDDMNNPTIQGGRIALTGLLLQTSPTDPANQNTNYIGTQGICSTTGDGGTGLTPTTAKGQCFGMSALASAKPGATNYFNVTGEEIDVEAQAGSSTLDKFGILITDLATDQVAGTLNDAMIGLSGQGGIGFDAGIEFTNASGVFPIRTNGTMIEANSPVAATVGRGIYFHNLTFTSNSIEVPGFAVDPFGNTFVRSISLSPTTFSGLTVCNSSTEGKELAITNSNTATYNAAITSAGSFHVIAYCNGTGWTAH
jgi:hypothetical protein